MVFSEDILCMWRLPQMTRGAQTSNVSSSQQERSRRWLHAWLHSPALACLFIWPFEFATTSSDAQFGFSLAHMPRHMATSSPELPLHLSSRRS